MYADFKLPPTYNGPCSAKDQGNIEGTVYHSYYQWVSIFLIFTAFLLYIPRCFWLMMEGGLMKFLGKGTTTQYEIEDPEDKKEKMVKFFAGNIHNKVKKSPHPESGQCVTYFFEFQYNIYFFGFIACEILNTIVVILIFGLTHAFLNYRFLTYGLKTWHFFKSPEEERILNKLPNPMCETFPRIASCNYHVFGTGGEQGNVNALCILSLNTINDKVRQ